MVEFREPDPLKGYTLQNRPPGLSDEVNDMLDKFEEDWRIEDGNTASINRGVVTVEQSQENAEELLANNSEYKEAVETAVDAAKKSPGRPV